MGRAREAVPAPHFPAPGAGLPAAVSGCVTHGPRLCDYSAPASGNPGPRGPNTSLGQQGSETSDRLVLIPELRTLQAILMKPLAHPMVLFLQ